MAKKTDCDRQRPLVGKRSYTISGFIGDLGRNLSTMPGFLAVMAVPGRMEAPFREKIMLSVSRMNQCRHCSAVHGKMADLAGLSEDEKAGLQDLDPGYFDHKEWVAIEYARRLAAKDECDDMDPELLTELHELYSAREIEDIEAVAAAINLATRTGNTFDALLSRIKGEPAEGSNVLDELVIIAMVAPVGLPALIVSEIFQRVGGKYENPREKVGGEQ